jgi:competence protein ComEC
VTVRAPHALAAALCGGIAAANAARLAHPAFAALAVGITAAAAGAAGERRVALLALAAATTGWWWGSVRLNALDRSVLVGRVGTAERTLAEVTAPARATSFSVRVPARVIRFGREGVHEPVLLVLPSGRAPPQGARLSFVATVELPQGEKDGFDEREMLRRRGVHVVLHADRWRVVGSRSGLGALADGLRSRLSRPLVRAGGQRSALLVGIVLGEDQGLPEPLRDRFRASGLYHLLAVSGQNVALVAGGALLLAWLVGLSRFVGQLVALLSISAYALAVGPQPSVLRAAVVGALGSLAWLAARQRDRWQFLLLAAGALLAWNPYSVFDPGFQLSFAAVAAIFTVVPPLVHELEGYPLPRRIAAGVALSTGCGLVTAPILWLQFHAVPVVAVPANLVAEPAMPPLLALALLAALVDPIAPGAATLLAEGAGLCASYIALCARTFGGLPFAQIRSGWAAAVLGACVVAAAAYAWPRWRAHSSRST